jgi:hypothetical protein
VLKSIDAGLDSPEEIGAFLGLDLPIVEDAFATLVQTDDLYLAAPPGSSTQRLSLTKKGKQTLEGARLVVPEERLIPIDFDGLLRRPIPFQGWLFKARDLKEAGIKEIPPFPQKRPEASDLTVREIKEAIRQSGGAAEAAREFLGVKAVERRELFFQTAVTLVYKAKDSDDIQLAFAIGGRLSFEHEGAFARANGPKKLGIVQAVSASAIAEPVPDQTPVELSVAEPERRVEALKQASSKAQADLDEARQAAEAAESAEERKEAEKRFGAASEQLVRLKTELGTIPLRGLDVYEHPELLELALRESKERLLIISPWIRAKVVNRAFISKLEQLLVRKVKVYIGYGLGEVDEQSRDDDRRAEQDLERLSQKYPNFKFVRLGDTHAKILISDRSFIVTTSFNWLSFRGDPNRTFRDEQGTFIAVPEFIDQRFRHLVSRIAPQDIERAVPEVEVFHGYVLTKPILAAGMSEAYIAARKDDGVSVFVKRVRVQSRDQKSLEREARIYERLLRLDSKHVVRVLDYIRDAEYVALVTECADGGNLQEFVELTGSGGGLTPRTAKEIALEIAAALQEFHGFGVVHRDLKPQNVLRFGELWKVADFGIAKNLSRLMTQRTFQQHGTLGFAAPEQLDGVEAHSSADVYSFGKLMVFLLTGQTDVDRLRYPTWRSMIKACVNISPEARPSMDAIIKDLTNLGT